ncbi:MAG: PEP-CTERM sorting domain-containing protein [Fimbriimonadales bacterium]|nr:PEP-CTERM sorting domain-containing protein [Fimbriimonadales bacterium]
MRWYNRLRRRASLVLLCAVVLASSVFPVSAQQEPSLTWLGVFPSGESSEAWSVSVDGQTVVGAGRTGNITRAFRWSASTGLVDLGSFGGNLHSAQGVSADGSVVVGYSRDASNNFRPFRWEAGSLSALPLLSGARWGRALGVSADGNVVVGEMGLGGGRRRAFRWSSSGGVQDLGILPGGQDWSAAAAVSADGGVVVGSARLGNTYRAFRWTPAGGMQNIDMLGGSFSHARAVSADGATVVGQWQALGTTRQQVFRWRLGVGMESLGMLPGGTWTDAFGVSADGRVIVGQAQTANGDTVAVRWVEGLGWQNLNLVYGALLDTETVLLSATAISPDGRYIVGVGYNALTDRGEAFLLDTVPEPGSLLALLAGCALLGRRSRRRVESELGAN